MPATGGDIEQLLPALRFDHIERRAQIVGILQDVGFAVIRTLLVELLLRRLLYWIEIAHLLQDCSGYLGYGRFIMATYIDYRNTK